MQHSYRTHDSNKSIDQLGTSTSTSQYRLYSQKPQEEKGSQTPEKGSKDDDQNLSPSKLRAKLRAELEQRARSCLHAGYKCSRPPATPASDYCALHILQATGNNDPALVHYTRCAYVYSVNGRRCPNAAPKKRSLQNSLGATGPTRAPHQMQNQSYCFEHSRLTQRSRTKQVARRKPPQGLDSALCGLSHYLVKSSNLNPMKSEKSTNPTESNQSSQYWTPNTRDKEAEKEKETLKVELDENGKIVPLDPMKDVDPQQVEKLRHPLQYASSTESEDEEPIIYGDVDQSVGFLGSDDECLDDFTGEDPLKHAGIYTATEANMILRNKLSRLQDLYVDQFKVMQQELKMKKMKLIPALKREYETLCSVEDQPKDSMKELNLYRKLKAFKRYNKKSGVEAILYERSLERTAKYMDGHSKFSLHKPHGGHHGGGPSAGQKCIFSEGGIKCTDKPMPCTKYCKRHILQDKRQILFKPCAMEIGDVCCKEPITGILEIDTCPLHYKIPEPRTYNIRKEDSESENSEDEQDDHNTSADINYNLHNPSLMDSSAVNNSLKDSSMDFSLLENDMKNESMESADDDEVDVVNDGEVSADEQRDLCYEKIEKELNELEGSNQINELEYQKVEVQEVDNQLDVSTELTINESHPSESTVSASETSVIIEALSDDVEVEDM
ncbi:KAT8 regulatory NSL complex subunit 2-like [Ctenocephalides felis]|uniref:KAT8 regulatory NSL complex subunit 2-like n=1 Tax=Ctenocephalides felis TaxID=7515 RepID=UPI000E6E3B6F|nr:KAT8 regulatory NSL complex subunit 2-like [Ctenocephalides felis]